MTTCSLIIPVYQHAAYLVECIDSAVKQVSPFDEIIIVDDCSPDPAVQAILSKYNGVERVRLFKNEENLGITKTQNKAVGLCKSEFVAFLDCDDILSPHAKEAFDAYNALRSVDYFFSNRKEIGPTGEVLRIVDVGKQIAEYETLTECLLEHMVATHFKVIRKSRLDEIGGFPTTSDGVQDWVVAVNIITDDNAVHMSEHVYSHRIHPNQTTGQDGVRYLAVVNAERERQLGRRGYKRGRYRTMVQAIAPFLTRVKEMPQGSFLLKDGRFSAWSRASARVDGSSSASLLIHAPSARYQHLAQDFFLSRKLQIETVLVVDSRVPASIAAARWSSAFIDHIVCLDSIARLAIEPWLGDRSKIVLATSENVVRKSASKPEKDIVETR